MTTNDVGTEGEVRNIKWNSFDLHGNLEEMWNTVQFLSVTLFFYPNGDVSDPCYAPL